MMSAEVTNVDHANDRITGKHEDIPITSADGSIDYYLTPAPYDIEFELKIGAEYMVEMDQIVEQILPFFNPFVYTKLEIPEISDELNIRIIFQGVSVDQESEIPEDDQRKIV